jgi:CheY-like chemotaxis protein
MEPASTARRSGAPAQSPKRAAPQILVVDDDADMRELLRLHLEGAGYRVTAAEDAVTAGHRLLDSLPDLIIADYRMPYMNGVDFVGALRADTTIPDLPVIFLTALENAPEIVGKTYGFPLLTKPLLADELLAAVARELAGATPAANPYSATR